MEKKVGIIGSGIVGQTLANGFLRHGYDVAVGTNSLSKQQELKSKTNGRAKVGSFEETAKFGEIVVLAVKGTAAEAAMKSARASPTSPGRSSSTRRIRLPMRLPSTVSSSISRR